MNTKRVNDEFHRLDVKLPIELYEQISTIAVNSFSARVHHISGKPEITPTLIYLLELGVQSFTSGNELIKKYDTDKYTDTIPITERGVKTLIKDELIPIQSKLDELSEIVYRLTYTDSKPIGVDNIAVAITEKILENITDNNTDKLEVSTDNNTDNDTDKIALSGCPNLPMNEELGDKVPDTEEKPLNEDKPEKEKKKTNYDKVSEFLASISHNERIKNKQSLAEKLGIDKGFFSRGKGRELWDNLLEFNQKENCFFKKQSI